MSAIKKLAAVFMAAAVIASSAAIYTGVGPAVELLASFEKEYENQLMDAQTMQRVDAGLDKAELDILELAKKLEGQARK